MRVGTWARTAAASALALATTRCYFLAPYSDLTSDLGRDAGMVPDALTTDSADGADGQPGAHFCEHVAPPAFCRDFDEGEAAGAGFTFVNASPGGTLAVDRGVGVGATASLRAAIPPTPGGGPLEYVAQDFEVTTQLHVAFDALADELGSAAEEVTLLRIASADARDGVQRTLLYYTTRTGAEIEEERTPPFANWPNALPGAPPIGKWVHYELDVVLTPGQPTTLTLTADGTTLLERRALGQVWRPGTFRVAFGLSWVSQSAAAWGFHYDDIVVLAR